MEKYYTRFAKNELDHIVEATKGMDENQTFTCLGCGQKMFTSAVNTYKQVAHFKHYGSQGKRGNGCNNHESYLHNFAKKKFVQIYTESKNFKLNIASMLRNGDELLDLKKLFPMIREEKKDGSFIPDCLLYNEMGAKVYIEIKYKSAVSEKKRRSGIPIIEIEVSDDEEFMRILERRKIDQSIDMVRLFNFKEAGLLPKGFKERKHIKIREYDFQEKEEQHQETKPSEKHQTIMEF